MCLRCLMNGMVRLSVMLCCVWWVGVCVSIVIVMIGLCDGVVLFFWLCGMILLCWLCRCWLVICVW